MNFTITNKTMSDTFGMCEIYTNNREWAVLIVAIPCQHGTTFINDLIRGSKNKISKYMVITNIDNQWIAKIAKWHNLRNLEFKKINNNFLKRN